MALTKLEKYDRRNACYAAAHKNDVLTDHGKVMRAFFEKHNREDRADRRAYRQAVEDIKQHLIKVLKVDITEVNKMMENLFEEDN